MLSDPRDLAALRRGMEIARDLGNSEAMKPFVKREILPGPSAGEALDNLIRDGAMSMHHPTCTAKMGQDDLSVVDAEAAGLRGEEPPHRRRLDHADASPRATPRRPA